MAVGAAVVGVRPRRRANVAFAAFAAAFGLSLVINNLVWIDPVPSRLALYAYMATGPAMTLAAATLVWTALVQPRAIVRDERRAVFVSAALAGGILAYGLWVFWVLIHDLYPIPEGVWTMAVRSTFVGFAALHGALWFALILLPLRHGRWASSDPHLGRKIAGLAAILLPYPTLFLGTQFAFLDFGALPTVRAVQFALYLVLPLTAAALWLRNTTGPQSHIARNLALATLGAVVAGLAVSYALGGSAAVNSSGLYGTARTASVLLLAYSVVRHQLLDIDLKIKWTLSRGTVAGAFVAAFFVFSEGAQELFSERLGVWPGLAAAGLLVFAIAPLQRFGDRVADTAMPHVKDTEEYRLVRKHEVYRAAVRSALEDGAVSDRERDILAALVDQLGLTASEARSIERELTRAAASGAPPQPGV